MAKKDHMKAVQLGQGGAQFAQEQKKVAREHPVAEGALIGGAVTSVGGAGYGNAQVVKATYHTSRDIYHDSRRKKMAIERYQNPKVRVSSGVTSKTFENPSAKELKHAKKSGVQFAKSDKAMVRAGRGFGTAVGGALVMYGADYYLRRVNGKTQKVHKGKRQV